MDNLKAFIESGIIEAYVLGTASRQENDLVEEMSNNYVEVKEEIAAVSEALEIYAHEAAIPPKPAIKPFLLATIDFQERMKNGEPASFPPLLGENSRAADFSEWINRKDLQSPGELNDFSAKIIGYTPGLITAIVWIKEMAPQEVHDDEYEKFLILEGTCEINIEGNVHELIPGSYLSIPLHKKHAVTVTSRVPCKLILQRVAA